MTRSNSSLASVWDPKRLQGSKLCMLLPLCCQSGPSLLGNAHNSQHYLSLLATVLPVLGQ